MQQHGGALRHRRGARSRSAIPAALAAAVCLLLAVQPALCRVQTTQTARPIDLEQAARRRNDLEEMVQNSAWVSQCQLTNTSAEVAAFMSTR